MSFGYSIHYWNTSSNHLVYDLLLKFSILNHESRSSP